jgi:hypothetical protein
MRVTGLMLSPSLGAAWFAWAIRTARLTYLHAYDSVAAAKNGIGRYFSFYNSERPHTALDGNTPDNVYFESQPLAAAA